MWSDFGLLGDFESVVDFDPEVPHGAFQLEMAQQELHGSEVLGSPVDQGSFGPAQGMCAVVLRIQSDRGYPFLDDASVLPGREVWRAVNTTGDKY